MNEKKLTKTQAKDLCKTIFGTSSGLETMQKNREYRIGLGALWGVLYMQSDGKVSVEIGTDGGDQYIYVIYDLDTMKPDYKAVMEMHERERKGNLEEWVLSCGEDRCCERIHKIWEARER